MTDAVLQILIIGLLLADLYLDIVILSKLEGRSNESGTDQLH